MLKYPLKEGGDSGLHVFSSPKDSFTTFTKKQKCHTCFSKILYSKADFDSILLDWWFQFRCYRRMLCFCTSSNFIKEVPSHLNLAICLDDDSSVSVSKNMISWLWTLFHKRWMISLKKRYCKTIKTLMGKCLISLMHVSSLWRRSSGQRWMRILSQPSTMRWWRRFMVRSSVGGGKGRCGRQNV